MRGLEKNCTRWHRQTDKHTDGHGDSMTNSAKRAELVKNSRKSSGFSGKNCSREVTQVIRVRIALGTALGKFFPDNPFDFPLFVVGGGAKFKLFGELFSAGAWTFLVSKCGIIKFSIHCTGLELGWVGP